MRITYSFRRNSIVSFPKNEGGKSTKKYFLYVNTETGEAQETKPEIMQDIDVIDITKDVLNERLEKARKQIEEHGYKGHLSKKAKTTITKAVCVWFAAMELEADRRIRAKKKVEHYPTFVTLTLSSKQVHDDNQLKRDLLNHFLISAKRDWGIEHYVWRAEPQGNGNIHLHILFDRFIKWQDIRNKWNDIQDKKGYVTEYIKVYKKASPNSTDVHKLKSITNPAAYICKYMTKAEEFEQGTERRKINGRLWGMSDSLLKLEYFDGKPETLRGANPVQYMHELDYITLNWLDEKYWSNAKNISDYVKCASFTDKIQYIALSFGFTQFAKQYLNHLTKVYTELYK